MHLENDERYYDRFDPETKFKLRAKDAARMSEAGRLLIAEGVQELERARAAVVDRLELAAGFQASGENCWNNAPAMQEQSGVLARGYRAQPRSPGSSFFVPETLCGRRTITAAGSSSASVGDRATSIGEQAGANSFLPLCTVVGPAVGAGDQVVGQFASLPSVTVLANETSEAADATPETAGAPIGPVNLGTYVQASKLWTLQAPGGAEALQRVILAALRTKAQIQILEGSGADGEATGLTVNSDVPNGSGTSIDWAGVCAATEAVEDGAGDGGLAWVVTAPAATILRQRERASGGSGLILADGRIGGYPAIVVGGTSSAHAVFGRWSDLIVCEWSPLELQVNPFAVFRASIIGVRGWFAFNFAPSVLSSFYAIPNIT